MAGSGHGEERADKNSSAGLHLKSTLSHFALFQHALWSGPEESASLPRLVYSPGTLELLLSTPRLADTKVAISFSTLPRVSQFRPALRTWRFLHSLEICKMMGRQYKEKRCGWVGLVGNLWTRQLQNKYGLCLSDENQSDHRGTL